MNNRQRPQVITATPTAFQTDGALDLPATRRIVDHALAGGVDAVFVNGTTAEFPALSREERAQVVKAAIDVAGPERVIAHIGGPGAFDAVQLTGDALAAGATRLAALTPYFLPAGMETVSAYLSAIRQTARDHELYLYLFPARTGVELDATQAAKLVQEHELAGAKVSIPGVDFVADLAPLLPDRRAVLSGNDGLLPEVVAAGGSGVVSGVSSVAPHLFTRLAETVAADDADTLTRLAPVVRHAVAALGPSIAHLKAGLLELGVIPESVCRMAIDPVRDRDLAAIRSVLRTPDLAGHSRVSLT